MNQKEKNYLLSRITEIKNQKHADLKAKYTTEEVSLTHEQRFSAFKKGNYKIKPGVTSLRYSYIENVLIFDGEKEAFFDEVKFSKAMDALNSYVTKLKDEIMLGEAKEAIQMLTDFANKQF